MKRIVPSLLGYSMGIVILSKRAAYLLYEAYFGPSWCDKLRCDVMCCVEAGCVSSLSGVDTPNTANWCMKRGVIVIRVTGCEHTWHVSLHTTSETPAPNHFSGPIELHMYVSFVVLYHLFSVQWCTSPLWAPLEQLRPNSIDIPQYSCSDYYSKNNNKFVSVSWKENSVAKCYFCIQLTLIFECMYLHDSQAIQQLLSNYLNMNTGIYIRTYTDWS